MGRLSEGFKGFGNLDRLPEHHFLYGGGHASESGDHTARGICAFQEAAGRQEAVYHADTVYHVFLRRHDSYLHIGKGPALDGYPVGADSSLRCFSL